MEVESKILQGQLFDNVYIKRSHMKCSKSIICSHLYKDVLTALTEQLIKLAEAVGYITYKKL